MDFQSQQKASSFTTLQIIHGALCMGVALFACVSFSIAPNKHSDIQTADSPLLYVAAIMAISMVGISNVLYNKQLSKIDFSAPVKQRFMQYQTASIIRLAPLEAAALFNIVSFLLSGSYISLAIAVALLIYMIMLRPTKEAVTEALKISYPDTLD